MDKPRARARKPLADRFWAKVEKTESCWNWTAATVKGGYGTIRIGGTGSPMESAHRVAYELLVGPIPEGLHLDHLCRNRICVNPAHLEPVTCAENLRRGNSFSAINEAKTECVKGHPFTDENTIRLKGGRRNCRTCRREYGRRRYAADPERFREASRQYKARKRGAAQ